MSQEPKQNPPRTTRNPRKNPTEMEAQGGGQATRADDTQSELASINCLLRGIGADVSSVKMGLEVLQSTVEKLGGRMSEAEARISNLATGASIYSTPAHVKKLQDKVTYLEDAGRRNNIRITGIPENAEKQDLLYMFFFVLSIFAEKLDLEVDWASNWSEHIAFGPKRMIGAADTFWSATEIQRQRSHSTGRPRQEESRMAGQQNLLLPGSFSGGTSAA
ncbi:hypothetical protein KUCAC02_018793 [Chaenocephalus aceratus]|uniref:Uncharacterized protein n=1 Tax=Chaenocephalus aceratus TaxID=36190 RepID=A0ACB9W9K5_CHAAC|nr:hypothetical protein KUCAC02_018793 [Chaenocephalus aceratus]